MSSYLFKLKKLNFIKKMNYCLYIYNRSINYFNLVYRVYRTRDIPSYMSAEYIYIC